MRLKSGLFVAALLVAPLPALAQENPKTLDQLAPEIDALFAKFQAEQHVPGIVYGVVKDGKLAYVKGIGVQNIADKRSVTADSLFRIASMTKAFTALSILKLRDDGKLRLDDLAEQYVSEMKGWTYPTKDSPRIRIRDLLQHVGGFVTDDPWGDRQQVLPQDAFTKMIASGVPFSRAPQSQHEYSNFGYALLGRIVANASGVKYTDYVQKTILTPLGMTNSGYDAPKAPKARYAIGYRWENDRWTAEPEMIDGALTRWAGCRSARTTMRNGSLSCSRRGRRATIPIMVRSSARPSAKSRRGRTSRRWSIATAQAAPTRANCRVPMAWAGASRRTATSA